MEIPAELSRLTRLSILNVVGNQLQYLPYSFTTLKSITAIWIAENQSRPILDLQLLRAEDGEKYLTCFLFPQQGHERPYEESMCTYVHLHGVEMCAYLCTCVCVDRYQMTYMYIMCVTTITDQHDQCLQIHVLDNINKT